MALKQASPKSFRLSDKALALLERLSDKLGVKHTAVMEMAIRRMATDEGVSEPEMPSSDKEQSE
jgi:hypothetical protein